MECLLQGEAASGDLIGSTFLAWSLRRTDLHW
ncbi:rCG44772 [Rattus norvegicus]|uniref:RCG44772 n=1 Tax=Rattus norvegicus TaxID=10116 RepID=A6I5C0_RAT|nr:rCG44772 [Rattus norvegicus]